MLTPGEAGTDLDFTTGLLANAANMSVAAPETGIVYTGTITPAGNTYRLGGGTGTLTLPDDNQLTGANNLLATNGGEVHLAGINDYSGTTTVSGTPFVSRTNQAIADTTTGISTSLYAPTTLTVTHLGRLGAPDSIGSSSSAASSLVIQGSTLKYVGTSVTTDRLFTIGTLGATIDVSNGGVFFENPGALAVANGGASIVRTLTLAGAVGGSLVPLVGNAGDGGVVGVTKTDSGTWTLIGDNTYSGPTSVLQGTLLVDGTQTGGGDYTVASGATLGGDGSLGGNVAADGTIAPGASLGLLTIDGNLTLNETSKLVIEIHGTTFGDYDRLEVTGTAGLGGTLRVELPDRGGGPYAPKLGDQFPFLAAQGGAGEMFDDFDLPELAAGLEWDLNPGAVIVFLDVVAALPGDYNFNGVVDAADYTVWRDSLGQNGVGLLADGDRNSVVNELDYQVWVDHFGQTLQQGAAALGGRGPVPEPSTLLLAFLAGVGMSFRRG